VPVGLSALEVNLKVDSPKIREMERTAMKRSGFKWAVILIGSICSIALVRLVIREAFLKNPQFTLKQITVRTEGPLSAQKIVRTSALTQGTNLLTVNLRELQGRLMRLPQVKKVKITRNYEGCLTLEVTQRKPVAWLECPRLGMTAHQVELGHFIDAEGVSFPCETLTEESASLPIIRDESLAQVQPGVTLTERPLQAALDLLHQLQERADSGQPTPKRLEIEKPYAITAQMDDGSRLTFATDDLPPQLARLERIWSEARQRQWRIATVNLMVQQNVPITFRSAPDLQGLQDYPTTAAVSERIPRSHSGQNQSKKP
jgi:cell division septal protein FtsQ